MDQLQAPQNHHFFAGGFSIHQPFWGSPMENPKYVGKVCRKRLSGNNVHCCEPFRHSCWHFFSQRIFCTKVFSERHTVPQIPKNMPLPQHLPRRSGLWSRLGQTQNLYNTLWSYHVAIVVLAPGEEDADKFYIIVKGGVRWLLRNFPFVAWTLSVLAVLLAVFLGAKICACCMLASKSCIKWGTGNGLRVPNCFPIITWSTQHFIVFKPAAQSCVL